MECRQEEPLVTIKGGLIESRYFRNSSEIASRYRSIGNAKTPMADQPSLWINVSVMKQMCLRRANVRLASLTALSQHNLRCVESYTTNLR